MSRVVWIKHAAQLATLAQDSTGPRIKGSHERVINY